jgi:hypothetical protein
MLKKMMKTHLYLAILLGFTALWSCQSQTGQAVVTQEGTYADITAIDTNRTTLLIVVSESKEQLGYGDPVAFIDEKGDTLIPFGKYAYFGTDTLRYYANVLEDGSKPVAINAKGEVLFNLFIFDNGPDYFVEGLTRVKRNGKMGFANQYGQVVIPCQYDFAKPFENGRAEVTFEAETVPDGEYTRVESEEWFFIDKMGKRLE